MTDIPGILKQVMESSSQLSVWAIAIVGGTVAVVVSTSYRRPDTIAWRLPYLLFLPGWICIGYSLYLGNQLVGKYLASIMVHKKEISVIASQVNDIYAGQRTYLLSPGVLWFMAVVLYAFMDIRAVFPDRRQKMKMCILAFPLLLFAADASAQECDCSNYPFKPNPPCYSRCVEKLSSEKNVDFSTVKNIDPGVTLGIKVLSESKDLSVIDFAGIKGKKDLERAALKSLDSRSITP